MVPFAVTIKLDSNPQVEKFDVKTCKKGHTMAILDAKKYGVKEGKQGFVETIPGKIKVSWTVQIPLAAKLKVWRGVFRGERVRTL